MRNLAIHFIVLTSIKILKNTEHCFCRCEELGEEKCKGAQGEIHKLSCKDEADQVIRYRDRLKSFS